MPEFDFGSLIVEKSKKKVDLRPPKPPVKIEKIEAIPSLKTREVDRKREVKRIIEILEINNTNKEDIEDIKIAISSEWKRFREFLDTGKPERENTKVIHRKRRVRSEVRDKIEELKDKYRIPYKEVVKELDQVLAERKAKIES